MTIYMKAVFVALAHVILLVSILFGEPESSVFSFQSCVPSEPKVIITLAPSSMTNSTQFVEYSISKDRCEALPTWEPRSIGTNGFPIALEEIIRIGEKDVISRYGASIGMMYLDNVDLRRIPNQREGRWYFVVGFNVNITSRPFSTDASEAKRMISIVLMDGSVVPPTYTDLSNSIHIVIPEN